MTHLPFTLAAYFFNSLSVIASKFLLNKAIPDPLIYVFYISLLSLLALFALPYTLTPLPFTLFLASVSTLLWTLGAYLMFKALKLGQVSRVIPIIGTLIPIFLLILGFQGITNHQFWAVLILIFGMIILTAPDWRGRITKNELVNELLSAISFALAYMLLRQAYLKADFLSIIVWSRIVLIPLVFLTLAFPAFRSKVISPSILSLQGVRQRRTTKQSLFRKIATLISFARNDGFLIFLGGQAAGVLAEFLLLFSISLANPTLVNSLQGTQYVFLFFLSREKYSFLILASKLTGIGLIGIGLYLMAI